MLSRSTLSQSKREVNTTRHVSPIRQFEDISSNIVYSNFSIKNIPISQTPSAPQTPPKPSKEDEENREMERLNNELQMLETILRKNSLKER
jgi:hypothetical protein